MRLTEQMFHADAGNAVHVYEDGSRAAFLFMRAGDDATLLALSKVFDLHHAPTVELGRAVPGADRTVGDCAIRKDGFRMTLQGVDPADWNNRSGMMGLALEISWGVTSPLWREVAEETGCVWACFVSEASYRAAVTVQGGVRLVDVSQIPPVPVLKLETLT